MLYEKDKAFVLCLIQFSKHFSFVVYRFFLVGCSNCFAFRLLNRKGQIKRTEELKKIQPLEPEMKHWFNFVCFPVHPVHDKIKSCKAVKRLIWI